MTLPEYLDTITFNDDSKLIWSKSELSQLELKAAEGKPYVIAEFGNIDVLKRLHQGMILSQLVTLTIYQEPTANDDLPSAATLMGVWTALMQALEHVDEGMYGYDIIELQYVGGLSPDLNERSSGLTAAVRFRQKFSMRVNKPNGG